MASRKTNYEKYVAAGVAIVLVCVIVLTLLFSGGHKAPQETLSEYRGIPFEKDFCPGTELPCWYALLNINGAEYSIPFVHHPTEVEDIYFEYPALDYLRLTHRTGNGTVVIGVPKDAPAEVGVAGAQFSRIIGDRFGLLNMRVLARVIGAEEGQVDCRYATPNQFIVLIRSEDEAGVRVQTPNCVVAAAPNTEELAEVMDAYAYRVLGIIPTLRPQ